MGRDAWAIVDHLFHKLVPAVAPCRRKFADLPAKGLLASRFGLAPPLCCQCPKKLFEGRVDGRTRRLPCLAGWVECRPTTPAMGTTEIPKHNGLEPLGP